MRRSAKPPIVDPPSPLVGRAREQTVLRERLEAAVSGRGSLVLIGGEAGIGKTALAEELACEAGACGAAVLIGRCYDLSETPPYGPWSEAFAHLPPNHERPELPGLSGQQRTEIEVTSQVELFAQVRDVLERLADEQPLVLVLDDLHWADPASLDLLRAFVRHLTTVPVLVLATYRDDELTTHHPLTQRLPMLVREARPVRIDLHPLDDAAIRDLVAARYTLAAPDEADLVTYLSVRAEGNPFYLSEMLRTLEDEQILQRHGDRWQLGDLGHVRVPALLRQVIEGRLIRLGEDAGSLLAIAAVIGQETGLDLWAAVGGIDEDSLLEVIERATEAHLLEESSDGLRVHFVHALIREALYDGLQPSRRRRLHLRVAEILAMQPNPDPDAVAYHFRQAGDARAVDWLLRAGERAQAVYAWLTASERFKAALDLMEPGEGTASERGWLLARLAWLCRFADPFRGIGYLEDVLRLAVQAEDSAMQAQALVQRGLLHCYLGEIRRGVGEMEDGVAAVERLPAPARKRLSERATRGIGPDVDECRAMLARYLTYVGRLAESSSLAAAIVSDPSMLQVDPRRHAARADAYFALAEGQALLGEPDLARSAFASAREVYHAASHHLLEGWALTRELSWVVLPYLTEHLGERQRLAAEAEHAFSLGSGADTNHVPPGVRLPLLLVDGHWDEAHRLALQWSTAKGLVNGRVWAAGYLAHLARNQGDPDLAVTLVREWLPDGPDMQPGGSHFPESLMLQRAAAVIALDRGELASAHAWLQAHDRWLAWSGSILGRAEGHLLWAYYQRLAGNLASARHHAGQALALARQPRQPLALLAAHRVLGELDAVAGLGDDAARHLQTALDLAAACAAPFERALTLLSLAELWATTGRHAETTVLLDEARSICSGLGAQPAIARIDALIVAPTGKAMAKTRYPAGLSEREVQVLRLVAQGLTDAQVAERLYLSPRTVSYHLRSIYNKLGVSTRLAATRFAIQHDLA